MIHQFVVHRLILNDDGKITLVPRQACLNANKALETFAEQLHTTFNAKPGKGIGFINSVPNQDSTNENEEVEPFYNVLSHLNQQMTASPEQANEAFLPFTVATSERLLKSLLDTGMVEHGFLIFNHYQWLATDYLLITLLNTQAHVEVDQALELTTREHLNLSKMQLAVRIDLTALQTDPDNQRYVSFIKGRMGRKVADFFMQFIDCEEVIDVKQQNKQLINNVDAYLATEQLDPQEKAQHRDDVQHYFKEKIDSGDELSITELADWLPRNEEAQFDFAKFNQLNEHQLEENIPPDPSTLRQISKFSGQGGGVSLSFERKLYGERIHYNPETDTLTIVGLPPNLRDQLQRQGK